MGSPMKTTLTTSTSCCATRTRLAGFRGSENNHRFLGQSVCKKGWARLVQLGFGTVDRMRRWARQGPAHRQNDGRMCNGRPVDESLSVDAWLQEIYESVAEWMPAASNVAASAVPALTEWLAAPAGPSVTTVTPGRNGARYLAHQSLQDLFHTYQNQVTRTWQPPTRHSSASSRNGTGSWCS